MKIRSLFFGLLLAGGVCLLQPVLSAVEAETNAVTAAPTNSEPVVTVLPELENLRLQLDAIQRANEEASGKWAALVVQNTALSNVLAGLQETLVRQKENEVKLSEQAQAFNLKVMVGAAAGIFLVFLASYWFQLRCLNRVMEFSRTGAGYQGHTPGLLESESSPTSKLLEAVKTLENRIHQLELPGGAHPSPNGASGESSLTQPASSSNLVTPAEPPPASNVALLLAKGEILLDMERLQEAVSCFQEALAIDPTNAEAHLKKGIALERMNRLELSLNAYEEALRLNPKRAFAYVHKARVLAALHRYDEALSVYDSALGKNAQKSGSTSLVS